jgi:hypothetical protein
VHDHIVAVIEIAAGPKWFSRIITFKRRRRRRRRWRRNRDSPRYPLCSTHPMSAMNSLDSFCPHDRSGNFDDFDAGITASKIRRMVAVAVEAAPAVSRVRCGGKNGHRQHRSQGGDAAPHDQHGNLSSTPPCRSTSQSSGAE